MKSCGSVMEFTRLRNADIMRAYREQLIKAHYIVLPQIFEAVANSPASRFWVSEERASIIVARMLAGKPLSRMRASKREMFDEIFRRFLLLRDENPEWPLCRLVAEVVNQPAPKFYFTPRTIGELVYRIRNGWYEKYPQ